MSEINFPNHILTLLDGTDILLNISQEFLSPKQISIPVKEYYKMVKYYITALDINNNEIYLKEYFLYGLFHNNQLEARRYETDLSLDELVAKLSVIENNKKNK
ncbi:11266_t:CDS:1 [Acaulospora morrowiae]|uniref:11266_t:CDS:1 n=1 Tax=Acaulospora morrowiae TaxID=94023 RepID=A0A9N9B6R2_9GLOM|nr:11266_t:CDS:1 [Acaulospora morrowiae]